MSEGKEDNINLDDFATDNPREIAFQLRQLINDGDRVSIMFNEGRDMLLTVLLEVDEEDNRLIFDWGGSEEINRRYLKVERGIFVASPHGIRNQFVCGQAHEIPYRGRRAFAVPLPKRYVRLQRREFFRLVLPITRRPRCIVKLADGGPEITFSVIDISVGGIGLEAPRTNLPLTIGQVLTGATLDLKGATVLRIDLDVRNIVTVQRGMQQASHVGCRFVKLSPAYDHELQKYITQVQREERAKLG